MWIFSSYFDYLFNNSFQDLSSYLKHTGKWLRIFQEDKEIEVRTLANNLAAGIIEELDEKIDLWEFRRNILEDKLKFTYERIKSA